MIHPDTYFLFVIVSILVCATPGPDVFYVMAKSLAQGKNAGMVASVSLNIGAYVHLFAAIAGLSAILATSSVAFTIVKVIGACYLVWIGIQAIIGGSKSTAKGDSTPSQLTTYSIFWQGFLCNVLNPKVAMFYLAFLPQFVDIQRGSHVEQLLILGLTVNMIGLLVNLLVVFFSTMAAKKFSKNPAFSKWFNRAMGTVFIAFGFKLVFTRQV